MVVGIVQVWCQAKRYCVCACAHARARRGEERERERERARESEREREREREVTFFKIRFDLLKRYLSYMEYLFKHIVYSLAILLVIKIEEKL